MARPQIPASILANRGVPIPLTDGSTVQVCYTYRSLMLLEERFGNIQAAMEIISKPDASQFTAIADILSAGLGHAIAPPEMNGVPLDDPQALSWLLDPADVGKYAEAMGAAFQKAFPNITETGGQADADPTSPSPGDSGTTLPASPSASPMTSSGA